MMRLFIAFIFITINCGGETENGTYRCNGNYLEYYYDGWSQVGLPCDICSERSTYVWCRQGDYNGCHAQPNNEPATCGGECDNCWPNPMNCGNSC